MADRVQWAILRALEWLGDLSPARRALVIVALLVLLVATVSVGVHFGLLPGRGHHYAPIFHW